MRPASAVFRDLQTGFGHELPCSCTFDQTAKISQWRHPNGAGGHVRRQFIEELLGQVDREVFKIMSGPFSFSNHQAFGVFQIGQVPTTRSAAVGTSGSVLGACGCGDSVWVPVVVLGMTPVSGPPGQGCPGGLTAVTGAGDRFVTPCKQQAIAIRGARAVLAIALLGHQQTPGSERLHNPAHGSRGHVALGRHRRHAGPTDPDVIRRIGQRHQHQLRYRLERLVPGPVHGRDAHARRALPACLVGRPRVLTG